MHLGFIGLGTLGKTLAQRLLDCGHTLTVWNRTPGRATGLSAELVASPEEVAQAADIIFLCLFDSQAVYNVLHGEAGLLSTDLSGKIIVDTTTNHFNAAGMFHEQCHDADGTYLEVPVQGSVIPASQGALTLLISGDEAAYQQVKPVLEDLGPNLFYLQQPTLATKMKLINNGVLASFMTALAEALALGEEVGLSRQEVIDILAVGGGNSMVLNAKRQKLLEEDFTPHFASALLCKDLHCLQDLAYQFKKPLFTLAPTKELYMQMHEKSLAGEDFSGIVRLFKPDQGTL